LPKQQQKRKAVLVGVMSTVLRFYPVQISVTASQVMVNIEFTMYQVS